MIETIKPPGSDLVCTAEGGIPITQCTCPDADARLKHASESEHVIFKWCRRCDRHFARCDCPPPLDFYMRSGGKEVPVPPGGFKTAAGGRVIPDLTAR